MSHEKDGEATWLVERYGLMGDTMKFKSYSPKTYYLAYAIIVILAAVVIWLL